MVRKIAARMLPVCLALCGILAAPVPAQVQEVPYNGGAAAAWQALLRLRTTATVLHITAHPDDEDAALLTWLARREGVRTGLLTINRGEGGANLIGPELYDALGILRTEELLAAGRYYGLDAQFFTRMADFGFSKRLDETLEHWGKENVLRDMVRVVRTYRPDVIISRFHGLPRDGHGNHQAAGLLSFEVFRAAADPQMFPEQIAEGLRPWRVKKLYLSTRPNEPSTLKIDVGEYDPLLGRSYREVAMEGYGMHRSQSVGLARPAPGSFYSSVRLVESTVPKVENEKGIFDGLDTSIIGLAKLTEGKLDITKELTEINSSVEAAIKKFNAREPWTVVPELIAGSRAVTVLSIRIYDSQLDPASKDHLWFLLRHKLAEFNDAMNKSLGLQLEVLVDPEKKVGVPAGMLQPRETFAVAIPGQQFSLTLRLVNRSKVIIEVPETMNPRQNSSRKASIENPAILSSDLLANIRSREESAQFLDYNAVLTRHRDVKLSGDARYSRPYWFRESEFRDYQYKINVPEGGYENLPLQPFSEPDLDSVIIYKVEGVGFWIGQPVQTSFIAAPRGEQRRLLTIAPAMNVTISPRVCVVSLGSTTGTSVTVSVSSNAKGKADGRVKLRVPEDWKVETPEQPFSFQHEGEKSDFTFKVTIPSLKPNTNYKIRAVAEYAGREYTEGYQVIAHSDLEPRHLYRPAVMEIRGVDVKVAPGLTVGYVMGVGDEVPKALEQIGVRVAMLGASDLAAGNLDQYDAIVVGIRASAVRDELKSYNRRLLEYVGRGGNLIWQYQTPEFEEAAYGPYPWKMGRNPEEVSEEDAKVTILDPENPVFNWPNKITAADFDGWVEERGSKWMAEWDERYKRLLECHDREQPPQRGGMLQAQFGKGTFTYAAYAFYRQLPAGVPGGYRLFANLISLKKLPKK
ncbi:MAG TPA: PIG-L family deacetylase [Blastocatellia bacterium]|nr:PIG-L family deacetylase [Blastocatellia bacterium]